MTAFPCKMESDERRRMSLTSCELLDDVLRVDPRFYQLILRAVTKLGSTLDDIISAFALYVYGLYKNFGLSAIGLALRLFSNFSVTKEFSSMINALCTDSTSVGAMLCEVQTLQGRGAGHVDLQDEAMYRCSPTAVKSKVLHLDQNVLRTHIRSILRCELDPTTEHFKEKDKFWTSRWLWCVNGAHNRVLEKEEPVYSIGSDLPKRVHRCVSVERCEVNPLDSWSGKTYYTASEKLEHGKRRAIFSCNSASYVCFEHLL